MRNTDKYRGVRKKAVDMLVYLKRLDEDTIGVKEHLELLFRFGIFRPSFLKDMYAAGRIFIFSLQHTYYDKLVDRLQKKKATLEERLKTAGFKGDMEALERYPCHIYNHYLHRICRIRSLSLIKRIIRNGFRSF